MGFSVKILLLPVGCLAMAHTFQWNTQPEYPAASREDVFAFPQNRQSRQPRPAQPSAQMSARLQPSQTKETFEQPLSWRFPDDPVEEIMLPVNFEERPERPLPFNSVTVQCRESTLRVEAKRDLFGFGQLIQTKDLNLGGCMATGEDANSQVVIFESELHECGSVVTVVGDTLLYEFVLYHKPTALGNSQIVRTEEVAISVECRYQGTHGVSSEALKPTWIPFAVTKVADELLYFSLKIMHDDWKTQRPITEYFLGDMMKFEASVKQFHHVPLRVFVDSCVATVIPNTDTVPRYAFLANHGCLMDAKLSGSSSRFMRRTQDDKLQFQVEAFMFVDQNIDVIYITCQLRATVASAAIDSKNKACSFSSGSTGRWIESSGRNEICDCCSSESRCDTGGEDLLLGAGVQWEQEALIGPISVKDRPLDEGHTLPMKRVT